MRMGDFWDELGISLVYLICLLAHDKSNKVC